MRLGTVFALFFLTGCLRGEIAHRPEIQGQVRGEALRLGYCTAVAERCEPVLALTPDATGAFTLPEQRQTITLFLGATPAIGYTLIWACASDGGVAGALVGGSVNLGERVELTLSPGPEVSITEIGRDATQPPTHDELRARVVAACQEGS